MTPETFLHVALDPGLAIVAHVCGIPVTPEARALVMAIAGQEADWQYRTQFNAPELGRGYWMNEPNGIVALLTNPATSTKLHALADALDIPVTEERIHEAVAWADPLAVGCARLLLWADPHPLPPLGHEDAAWQMYLRCWQPGTPRPADWPANYTTAMKLIAPNTTITTAT